MIDLDQLTLQSYSVLVSEFFRFLGTACKPHRIGKEDTGLKNVKNLPTGIYWQNQVTMKFFKTSAKKTNLVNLNHTKPAF